MYDMELLKLLVWLFLFSLVSFVCCEREQHALVIHWISHMWWLTSSVFFFVAFFFGFVYFFFSSGIKWQMCAWRHAHCSTRWNYTDLISDAVAVTIQTSVSYEAIEFQTKCSESAIILIKSNKVRLFSATMLLIRNVGVFYWLLEYIIAAETTISATSHS